MSRSIYNHAECFMRSFKLKISASGTCHRLERDCLDAYYVFYRKVATIGHYNLVSNQHFCRNSLFWTILVKIFALRCTANCSVLHGELPK